LKAKGEQKKGSNLLFASKRAVDQWLQGRYNTSQWQEKKWSEISGSKAAMGVRMRAMEEADVATTRMKGLIQRNMHQRDGSYPASHHLHPCSVSAAGWLWDATIVTW
jgi:hypothetical protein